MPTFRLALPMSVPGRIDLTEPVEQVSRAARSLARAALSMLRNPRLVAYPTLVTVVSLGAGIGVPRADAIVATAEKALGSVLDDVNILAGEGAGIFSWASEQSGALLASATAGVFGPAGLAMMWASHAQPISQAGGITEAGAFGTTRLASATVALGSLVGLFDDAGTRSAGDEMAIAALPALHPALVHAATGGVFASVSVVGEALSVPPAEPGGLASADTQATDFASLFSVQEQIDLRGGTSFADIRITRLASGVWTVQIPSTQGSFVDPVAAAHPNDVVADVVAMAGHETALGRAVTRAMSLAGIGADDPVMMVGFSLGGITAAQLVSDPSFPFHVTHIVTAGAPIASFAIPAGIEVLSLELRQDAVPKLDGAANPERSTWSTVEGNAPLLAGESSAPGIAGAHNTLRYAAFASRLVAENNPEVAAFSASAAPFLTGEAHGIDYAVTR